MRGGNANEMGDDQGCVASRARRCLGARTGCSMNPSAAADSRRGSRRASADAGEHAAGGEAGEEAEDDDMAFARALQEEEARDWQQRMHALAGLPPPGGARPCCRAHLPPARQRLWMRAHACRAGRCAARLTRVQPCAVVASAEAAEAGADGGELMLEDEEFEDDPVDVDAMTYEAR
jgi:hypothetical protein